MNKKTSSKAKPRTRPKKIEFNLHSSDAEKVVLAGDFNHWDAGSLPMKKNSNGIWETRVELPPGRYEYRFWVDGVWQDDPNARERVANPFGSQNCVRIAG
jgi:1,4-alpha-glucan branching enzyme